MKVVEDCVALWLVVFENMRKLCRERPLQAPMFLRIVLVLLSYDLPSAFIWMVSMDSDAFHIGGPVPISSKSTTSTQESILRETLEIVDWIYLYSAFGSAYMHH